MKPRLTGLLLAPALLVSTAAPQSVLTGSGVAPPAVRVRWIVDVSKTLGYQDFDRPSSKKEAWKSQQGIAFLTPDEVAIYQVVATPVNGSAGAFSLHAGILDARDGHEIKSLVLPSSTEIAKLLPTHGGAFLVRTGDVITLYSSKFETVASRKLPQGKDTSFDDWQIDVAPSGAQIILVHQQVWEDAKGNEKDSRADVEVLDSETFKTIKNFSVPWLEQWSAGDNLIVTPDPDDEDSTEFGLLDFSGKWRALKTSAEGSAPGCPYRLEPLEHQLFAGHDCDDLVVVGASGSGKFKQSILGEEVLVSVAGADRYLAEALVEPERSRAYISV